jgi:hypothetical protein
MCVIGVCVCVWGGEVRSEGGEAIRYGFGVLGIF